MQFDIPIITNKSNPNRLNTALHLIVVFLLIVTGVFLLLYQSVWEHLPAEERVRIAQLQVDRWKSWLIIGLGIALLFVVLFRNRLLHNKGFNRGLRIAELLLLAGFAVTAYLREIYTPGFLYCIVIGLIGYSFLRDARVGQVPHVLVDTKGLTLPVGAVTKTLLWREVEQVLLRHGVLTIDCCDNRFYQWNTLTSEALNVDTFQEFCNAQIEKAKPDRRKDDW